MRERTGDIWEEAEKGIIVITTNGAVTRDGRAPLGRGLARQAGERFPWLSARLGELIRLYGNHVHDLGEGLVSLPGEHSPFENPDLRLIRRSLGELVLLAADRGWPQVFLPRPGCGGGGLAWSEVRPLLEELLDDRFTVIDLPATHSPSG